MKLRVTFGTVETTHPDPQQNAVSSISTDVEIPDDTLVTYMGLEYVDDNGTPSTILRTLFTTHTDMKGLHTICRRYGDAIDALERGE